MCSNRHRISTRKYTHTSCMYVGWMIYVRGISILVTEVVHPGTHSVCGSAAPPPYNQWQWRARGMGVVVVVLVPTRTPEKATRSRLERMGSTCLRSFGGIQRCHAMPCHVCARLSVRRFLQAKRDFKQHRTYMPMYHRVCLP